MSPASFIAGLVVLLAVSAHAEYDLVCPEDYKECSGKSSVDAFQYGVGSCKASADSYCSVYAYSYDCVDVATQFINDPLCRSAYVEDDAYCLASAAVDAYVSTYATVLCDGKWAYGCASAEADAYAIACGIATSIVELSINLGMYTAECSAWVGVAVKALAEAAVSASADVCTDGDGVPKFDYDYAFDYSVQDAIAKAYASCFAYCSDYGVYTAADGETYGYTYEDYYYYYGKKK